MAGLARMPHNFGVWRIRFPRLQERGKATLSRLTPTMSAQQGAFINTSECDECRLTVVRFAAVFFAVAEVIAHVVPGSPRNIASSRRDRVPGPAHQDRPGPVAAEEFAAKTRSVRRSGLLFPVCVSGLCAHWFGHP